MKVQYEVQLQVQSFDCQIHFLGLNLGDYGDVCLVQ